MTTISIGVGKVYFPKAILRNELPEGTPIPLPGKFSMRGRMTNMRIGGVPVKSFTYMRIRHKATGRAALGIPMKDGLVAVQFDNISAMGILASGWHIYPRHHFKRRR